MKDFDFWTEQLNSLYESMTQAIDIEQPQESKIVLVSGDKNSGKSIFVDKCLTKIRLSKEVEKKIGKIIKIIPEDVLSIYDLNKGKSKLSETLLKSVEITPPVPLFGLNFSFNLGEFLGKHIFKKKINVLWFENVTLNGLLSINQVKQIISNYQNSIVISIVTTNEADVVNHFKSIEYQLINLEMPSLTFDVYKKKKKSLPEHKRTSYTSIIERLKKLDSDDQVKELIELSQHLYGNLEYLLDHIENGYIENERVISKVFKVDTISDVDLDKLLLFLYSIPNGVHVDWFESAFSKSTFDYIEYLDKLSNTDLVRRNNNLFKLNKNIPFTKEDFFSSCENKRTKRNVFKLIDEMIKKEQPENYLLRYHNALGLDVSVAKAYFFIYAVRNRLNPEDILRNERIDLGKEYRAVLKIMYSPINYSDENLLKLNSKLNEITIDQYPSLVIAEILYYQLTNFLNCSYSVRKKIRPKIEITLHKMLKVFLDLNDNNENEMAIKVGLLLAPEMVNYLSVEEINDAKNVYKIVEKKIFNHMKYNYPYFKYYDVILKGISTSLISYKKAYYELWLILDDFEMERNSFLDYTQIIPMIFSNILGVAFYIGKQEIQKTMTFYQKNTILVDSNKDNNYKIMNNIFLAKFFLSEEQELMSNEFKQLKDHHVSTINYAGMLFYEKKYDKAKLMLNKIEKEQKSDDFYLFYCEYNKCLIDIVEQNSSGNLRLRLDRLIVPTLFTDRAVIKYFESRKKRLLELYKQVFENESLSCLREIDNFFLVNNKLQPPIFSYAWLFSDYQYWS